MKYFALATDYDGTLALHGKVDEPTVAALERVRASGRRLIMVTGRELDELATVCPYLDRFDLIVAENGALLFNPKTREHKLLGDPPPHKFVETLIGRGVGPISVGRAIVATWEPHEKTVLETIHELGLELQVIFNKGAVMVLPSGVNKATGLQAALQRLCLSPHNVVGIGDAENDHAFLSYCECGVAVANALPVTKEYADWVTVGDHGSGVIELADRLLAEDLSGLEEKVGGRIELGKQHDGALATVPAYGISMLVAGTSGAGKSTLSTGFVERLAEDAYQFCIVDPEGDYEGFENVVVLGDAKRPPGLEEVKSVLEDPTHNLVVNLLGVKLDDRPEFFASLWSELHELRERVGRPHWIVLDEAHHILPAVKELKGKDLQGTLLITVHPEQLPAAVHSSLDLAIAIGDHPGETLGVISQEKRRRRSRPASSRPGMGSAIGCAGMHRRLSFASLRLAPSIVDTSASTRKGVYPRTRASTFAAPGKSSTCARRIYNSFSRLPMAWMMKLGSTICGAANTRSGFAPRSRTTTSRKKPRKSNGMSPSLRGRAASTCVR
jgi:HAD superfamily hydrolase (TIGR01484 family)